MDLPLIERTLAAALERGGDYADVYVQRSRSRSLSFEEGKVKTASESRSQGVGIRVQQGEATGYAVCEDFDPAALIAAARRAAAIAAAGGAAATAAKAQQLALPDRYPQRRPLADLALAERVALARRASERAFAADRRVQWVSVGCSDSEDEIEILTSDGIHARDRRPYLAFSVSVLGADGARRESAWYRFSKRAGGESLDQFSPEAITDEAVRRMAVKLIAEDAPAGSMPVVLASREGGVMLHEAVGHGLEADFNRKNVSAFSGKVGESVANPLVTVVDRGDVAGGCGSLNVDDEGQVPGSTTLIEKGRLVGYMNDRLSARLMGVPCTGNGRRESYHHVPQPRMRITVLEPGASKPEEILRSVKRGLYVAGIGGGSVDITKGDFNFNVEEAYLIEDGKRTRPVKGACLIGNGPAVMRQVTMVGDDLATWDGTCGKYGQGVPVGCGCPTLLIAEMTVGGAKS